MKTLTKFEVKSFILISFLFIFSLDLFANGNNVVVTTYAGTGFAGSQDGDALTEAKFGLPTGIGGFGIGICFDNEGNLLVADAGNDKIRKISPTGVVTTIAGSGIIGYLDGPANVARFNFPSDIAVDSIGNIYITDHNNSRIRKLDTAGIVSTLAGSGVCAHVDGIGTAASFCTPTGIEMDNEGNLIVADLNNSAIRKVTPAGVVTTVKVVSAGAPIQVALDKEGNIFFTVFSNRIFKIDTNGVETLIAGGLPGFADDTGASARFNLPWGIALDNDGNIYVGDQQNHRVRKIDTNNVVTTLAGTGVIGFKDGPADSAQFNNPSGLCHDARGSIFVADQGNSRIRKIAAPVVEEVTISGKVFGDVDLNGIFSIGDTKIVGAKIKIQHAELGTFYVFNNFDGSYEFKGPAGTYNVSLVTNEFIQQLFPNTYIINIEIAETSNENNFAVIAVCRADRKVRFNHPFPFSTGCPNVPMQACVEFRNNGGLNHDLSRFEISFNLKKYSFVKINPPTCETSLINEFNIGNYKHFLFESANPLQIGEVCTICLEFVTKEVDTLPTIGCFDTDIFATCAGIKGEGSFLKTYKCDLISCAIDPNDKMLLFPKGCGTNNKIAQNEILEYLVRFQNTGSASAFKVIITDTLDNNLDIETLSLTGESHLLTKFEMLPENVVVWTFENINLPDSAIDFEGSKGFVRFSIAHNKGLIDSTVVKNSASIFFDLNPPVITNKTFHTVFQNPNPIADFKVERQCSQNAYDFTYTGGSNNVNTFWEIADEDTVITSSELNPEGIVFSSPGKKLISLYVFDQNGCSSFKIDSIEVEDISCGNNSDKILVCHKPLGNVNNQQLICISPNALEVHLTHGDCIGSCTDIIPSGKTDPEVTNFNNTFNNHTVSIYPNPFNNHTTIKLIYLEDQFVEIKVLNILGQEVLNVFDGFLKADNEYKFEITSTHLIPGIYFVKVNNEKSSILFKLVMLN